MSQLLDFYRGDATDSEGRRLRDLWTWDDDALEAVHDFIQWLFPLPEPSQFNPNAPLLTQEDIAGFRADEALRANLRRSFDRILTFLGLAWDSEGHIDKGPNFMVRVHDVWMYPNHNWLRITRILRSLSLLGMEDDALQLYDCLSLFYELREFPILESTFRYWTVAVRSGANE
jgi:hypothetical protein